MIYFRADASEVMAPRVDRVLGNISFSRIGEIATARIDNGETQADVLSDIATRYGAYIGIIPETPSGQKVTVQAGNSSTGLANEYSINGTVFIGWEFSALPPAPTDAEIATVLSGLVTSRRSEALNHAASLINASFETPMDVAAFVADGLSWYDDPSSVSAQKASNFAALQAGAVIL